MLDIQAQGEGYNQSGSKYFSGYTMTFRILDQYNRLQMTTSHRLLSKRAMDLSSSHLDAHQMMAAKCDCLPLHGPVPPFRKHLARYSLLGVPFVAVVCPLILLLIFVFLALAGWRTTYRIFLSRKKRDASSKPKKIAMDSHESSNENNLDDVTPTKDGKSLQT